VLKLNDTFTNDSQLPDFILHPARLLRQAAAPADPGKVEGQVADGGNEPFAVGGHHVLKWQGRTSFGRKMFVRQTFSRKAQYKMNFVDLLILLRLCRSNIVSAKCLSA
jgi:hypothetical protein